MFWDINCFTTAQTEFLYDLVLPYQSRVQDQNRIEQDLTGFPVDPVLPYQSRVQDQNRI